MKQLSFLFKQASYLNLVILGLCFLITIGTKAQSGWEVGIHAGVSLPVTGYKGVFKNGWLVGAGGRYRFGNGNFAIGMKTNIVRLQRDRNSSDAFQNARMTIAPLLFTTEYGLKMGALRPYFEAGLGGSLFNLSYDVGATEGEVMLT